MCISTEAFFSEDQSAVTTKLTAPQLSAQSAVAVIKGIVRLNNPLCGQTLTVKQTYTGGGDVYLCGYRPCAYVLEFQFEACY